MVSNHFHFFYCTEIPAGSQYDTETLFYNIVPQYISKAQPEIRLSLSCL